MLGDTLADDTITCIGDHATPVSLSGHEDDLDEVAIAAGWIETDAGWYCPDVAHEEQELTTYTLIPLSSPDELGKTGEELGGVTFANVSDAMAEFADLIEQAQEDGRPAFTLTVELGLATLSELRAQVDELE